MPIYKLNPHLSGGGQSRPDERHHKYRELPESDWYSRTHHQSREDASRQRNVDSLQHKKDTRAKSAGRQESFIEREIREQRRREMELAEDHKHCATASHADQSRTPQTATRRHSHDANDYRHSHRDDNNDNRQLDEYRCSHPGERLIVRELLEQRQREEELRRYWREMGFKLNDDNNNSDDGDNDNTQRRHNDDEQRQKMRRRSALLDSADSFADYKKQTHADEHTHTHAASHTGATEADKSSSCTVRVYVSSPASAPIQSLRTSVSVTQERPGPTKELLLPLKRNSCDKQCSVAPLFDPLQETSLQCEVRRSRDRQRALRHSGGLTTQSHNTQRPDVVQHSAKSTLDADGAAQQRLDDYEAMMRRCARNRLTAEIQRDRGRELELRCRRIIRSVSEERPGNREKFVDVRLSEAPAVMKHHSAADAVGLLEHGQVKSKHTATMASMTDDKLPTNSSRMPPVLRRYSDWQNSLTTDTSATPSRMSREAHAGKDMTQSRRRENELRKLHEMTRHERTMTSHDAGPYPSNCHHAPTANNQSATTAFEPEVTSHGGRLRPALIARWEEMAETCTE